ncbi:transcription elongation factor GreA [Pseudothermotoga hypogea DSM 11164 = NBRC 106472]|uniref:Transcription elongation factor GreA n=2 Tax=Pseudothermotoga hypogea TaxID=57487 RepID=A0A0X1KNT0_9THEM|nr:MULTISPECIES: transcription elongation factor GreA [Pseudothermotoga]AJC72874.1 transcription elongation factor GreA [Pseudothermotoga hypogea DSM 11164 = NBRC 106472]MBC7123894.1 transcription elongation factor GreA [Pseudothermotoga sp.]MDI6863419.1 transcription elongation factor GreA [Pseudothermotoga sp.]
MKKSVIKLTKEGYEALKQELESLRQKLMYEISQRIKEARELGDLAENTEYDEAKNEQGRINSRIAELEQILNNAEIIESAESDVVSIGSWVVIRNLNTGEERTIRLVNPHESDIFSNKVSVDSPVGRVLLNKKIGEIVRLKTPSGQVKYEIIGIRTE